METDALANALQSLADATAKNTELLEKIVEWWWSSENKRSYEEIKKDSSLEKIAYYTVQKKEMVSRKETFLNAETFKSRKDAENYLAEKLKGMWRIIVKVQYLSTKQPDYEEQKRADNGKSLDIQGVKEIPVNNS